ncbi:hypothetical protein P4U43_08130 [Arthrobacter sp. EH-1B-1]|uniref:DUF3806 domain-containing protein n=1 Tax=Arthrobacter vasquezii TaxID=2977629 RepID=A0ABT6CW08_9MICC|nr:hypothetical protein [Arthrobacter vasquezii]MDF9277755.1 hypothetical protein [Arthrobacter vasquezii]
MEEVSNLLRYVTERGGYGQLSDRCAREGEPIELSYEGIARIEDLLASLPDSEASALGEEVSRYLGDVLCATTPGVRWELADETARIQISAREWWDVDWYVSENIAGPNVAFLSAAIEEMQRRASLNEP